MYKQFVAQPDLGIRWAQIKESMFAPGLWAAFLLMLVNWGIEARKWQIQLAPLQKITFANAYKSILAGCSITMVTPNRIGEFGGRILYVEEKNRVDAIPLTILGSISQLFVTTFLGAIALFSFFCQSKEMVQFKFMPTYTVELLMYVSISATVFFALLYFRVRLLVNFLSKISFLKKYSSHFQLLHTFSRKQLLRILFLSFLRYTIFILQYILVLNVMQVKISFVICAKLLALFYLIMAIAPTIGFTELPTRAIVGVEILEFYSSNVIGIQVAFLAVWVINLVVPALAGSLLIFGKKIIKEK